MADVLLVGPEEVFPVELEDCIKSQGHSPHRVTGAGQALIASDKAKKLLALIDVGSSVYDAQDLMRKILARLPEACIVATADQPSV